VAIPFLLLTSSGNQKAFLAKDEEGSRGATLIRGREYTRNRLTLAL